MKAFQPSLPYKVHMYLLNPVYETVKGVKTPKYEATGDLIYCSFRTYGGTEQVVNGVYSLLDTANIETWYRPDIKPDSRLQSGDDAGVLYEVIGVPENINMENKYLRFKVKRIKGGA